MDFKNNLTTTVIDDLERDITIVILVAAGILMTVLFLTTLYTLYLTFISLRYNILPLTDVIGLVLISGNQLLALSGIFTVSLSSMGTTSVSTRAVDAAHLAQIFGHVMALSQSAVYLFMKDADRRTWCILTLNTFGIAIVAVQTAAIVLSADLPRRPTTEEPNVYQKTQAIYVY